MYWSRRAWSEYGAISESPALQIRFCHERCPPDMALFFSIRSQEESRHAEVCYRMAEALGGYFEQPAAAAYQGSVATHGIRKIALDPEVSPEGTIAALVCAAEEIAFDVFRHIIEIATNPVARQIASDGPARRDAALRFRLGLPGAAHAPPQPPRKRDVVRNAVVNIIEKVELNGYHSSWLAPDSPAARAEERVDDITWEAGLGATTEALEKPVFLRLYTAMRERMRKDWGIEIPLFTHPKFDAPF